MTERTVPKLPASMTSAQFLALLDEMVTISLATRIRRLVDFKSRYETFYRLSVSNIHEADELFQMLDDFNADARKKQST